MQRESVRSIRCWLPTCLCIVCSVLVSSAAVLLRPRQEANKLRQMQKDVLRWRDCTRRHSRLRAVSSRWRCGSSTWRRASSWIRIRSKPDAYDPKVASKDPEFSIAIAPAGRSAGLETPRESIRRSTWCKSRPGRIAAADSSGSRQGTVVDHVRFSVAGARLSTRCAESRSTNMAKHPVWVARSRVKSSSDQWQGKVVRDAGRHTA